MLDVVCCLLVADCLLLAVVCWLSVGACCGLFIVCLSVVAIVVCVCLYVVGYSFLFDVYGCWFVCAVV